MFTETLSQKPSETERVGCLFNIYSHTDKADQSKEHYIDRGLISLSEGGWMMGMGDGDVIPEPGQAKVPLSLIRIRRCTE
jgi:hypothetical protein